jgi:hypothetical protein
MSLEMPNYIRKSGLYEAQVQYDWKDPWKCRFEVPRLKNRISPIYGRGILALAAGFAEWVVWCFRRHKEDPIFLQFIEATWASVIDRRYMNHVSKAYGRVAKKHFTLGTNPITTNSLWKYKDDLCDPIRGPAFVAIHHLCEVADLTIPSRRIGSLEAVYLSNLAEQILGKATAFNNWRRTVIERLTKYHARESGLDNWMGSPVPREALDPDFDYKPEMADKLLSDFIENLDPSKNHFLLSPAELSEIGFEGKPYTL